MAISPETPDKRGDPMTDDTAYQRLANAIVCQAVKDYRLALLRLRRNPKDRIAREMVQDCEKFFRSEWCYLLSGMDADYFLRKLRDDTS